MPRAVQLLERQLEALPGYERGWLNLAQLYVLTKQLDRSEWAAKQCLALANPKSWEAYYHLGNLYEAAKLDKQAETAYRKTTELAPKKEFKALGNLGALMVEMDDMKNPTTM